MKKLLRSRSDTDFLSEKINLDIINHNLRMVKYNQCFPVISRDKTRIKTTRKISRKETFKNNLIKLNTNNTEMNSNNEIVEGNLQAKEDSNPKDLEKFFKLFFTKILQKKISMKKKFLGHIMTSSKNEKNIYLELIIVYLRIFKNKFLNIESGSESDGDSSCDSKGKNNNEIFLDNLNKFERLLTMLITISPEDMFREVKSMILIEFDSTAIEIQNYLKQHPNDKNYLIFSSLMQNILFIISSIAFRLDYYAISINCLVENLNRFIVDFVELSKDSNSSEFIKSLNMVQKFIRIKKNFMKDFCEIKNIGNDSLFSISPNKFCSFGIYFFRNLMKMIVADKVISKKDFKSYLSPLKINPGYSPRIPTNTTLMSYARYSRSYSNMDDIRSKTPNQLMPKKHRFNILYLLNSKNIEIHKLFKIFFTSKLANWKYASINTTSNKKEEICRICEKTLKIDSFILHLFYCKEQKVNIQSYNELKNELNSSLEKLRSYKDLLIKDKDKIDFFFSPKSEFNQKFLLHVIEKEQKNVEELSKYSESELLNRIIDTINKEKNLVYEYYLKYPNKLTQLISILHFTIFIFCQNKNCNNFSNHLNQIFADLIKTLMKKIILMENILTLYENKEKATSYIKKYIYPKEQNLNIYSSKRTTVKQLCNQIDQTTNKFRANSPKLTKKFSEKKVNHHKFKAIEFPQINSPNPNMVKAVNSELKNFASTHDVRYSLFSSLKNNDNNEDFNSNESSHKSSLKSISENKSTQINHSTTVSNEDEKQMHNRKKSLFERNNSENCEEDSYDYNMDSSPLSYLFINEKSQYDINEVYELDSQFDEMIEIMDEMQHSDRKEFISESNNLLAPVTINDFKFINTLGKGGYGRVDLYRKITTGDLYAIKSVNINKMKSLNVSGLVKNETIILNEVYSDFVVKCYYIFSDNIYCYYAMEYHPGGDLLSLLNAYLLDDDTIRFITAEIILALEYLHSKDIIHRDIKPENIVISNDGHFKLTDFGLSETGLSQNKYVLQNENFEKKFSDDVPNEDSKKPIGTVQYMAPEAIEGQTITEVVDYWALGVLIFELFTGKLPFSGKTNSGTFEKILNVDIDWTEFDNYNEDAKDLIKKFLIKDYYLRWGTWNIEQVKAHKFFNNFDWKNIKNYRDSLVIQHVKNNIEKIKKKEVTHTIPIDTNTLQQCDVNTDYFCIRLDNLDKKNKDIIRINLKSKKLDFETNDNMIDMMRDMV